MSPLNLSVVMSFPLFRPGPAEYECHVPPSPSSHPFTNHLMHRTWWYDGPTTNRGLLWRIRRAMVEILLLLALLLSVACVCFFLYVSMWNYPAGRALSHFNQLPGVCSCNSTEERNTIAHQHVVVVWSWLQKFDKDPFMFTSMQTAQ